MYCVSHPINGQHRVHFMWFSPVKLIETKMHKIVFGLSLFWMLANVCCVEVRRDEKVFAQFSSLFYNLMHFHLICICSRMLMHQIKVATKAITRMVSTSSQRMSRENGSHWRFYWYLFPLSWIRGETIISFIIKLAIFSHRSDSGIRPWWNTRKCCPKMLYVRLKCL